MYSSAHLSGQPADDFGYQGRQAVAPEVPLAQPGEAHQQRSINSKLLIGEEGLDAVRLLQFGPHVSAEDRVNIHLEDGRQISLSPAIFREIAPRTKFEIKQ
jgi:hypothetical protein